METNCRRNILSNLKYVVCEEKKKIIHAKSLSNPHLNTTNLSVEQQWIPESAA